MKEVYILASEAARALTEAKIRAAFETDEVQLVFGEDDCLFSVRADDSRGTLADIAERDRFMADLARRYLDFMFAYRQTDYLMAWGMMDHYSWLQNFGKRPDGILKRPSLYDDDYQAKPLRQAI